MALTDSLPISLIAAADLSAKIYRFGKQTSTGINVCSVAGERADGVIGSKPTAATQAVALYTERLMAVECGGTITAGDSVTTDANGKAVTAVAGQYVNGIAVEDGVATRVIGILSPLSAAVNANVSSVSAAGAIPPTAGTVLLSVSGTKAYTLADGTVGARMHIECVAAASSPLGTVTIATPFTSESATHVFTTAGQSLTLLMTASGWKVIGKRRVGSLTVVVGTDVLTGYDLVETYNLSITATVTSTTTMALPAGQVEGEVCWIRCTTAASTPNGTFDGTYKTLGGVAATHAAVNATTDYEYLRWDGAAWQELVTNSVTLS